MWLIIFSGLIACTGQPVSSFCPIVMSPPTAVLRFGERLSVNCSSSSDQIEGMGWESTVGGTGLIEGISSVPLVIDSVTDWTMDPICFINVIDSDIECLQSLSLTVYKTPDSVSMSEPSPVGPMVEGEKYRMQCAIANVAPARNLSVHWHKGNEIVSTETFDESRRSPVNKSSVFNLTAHRDDNGTQIWCEAELSFWPAVPDLPSMQSKSHELIVLYPPTFSKPEHETLEVSPGSKVILDCTATGNPVPVYSWHFPHRIQQTNKNPNQPILTPSFQLPGTYNCTASNTQGTKTKSFTVIETTRDRTTFAALVGVVVPLGVLLFIAGLFFVTTEGTLSFSKGSYLRGRPTSSGPV